jgi:hypothetical protein
VDRSDLSVADAEAFARRIVAAIDADEEALRRAADAAPAERHDADRARVASDLEGLRRAHRHPGRGLEEGDLAWLRRTFSDGLLSTGAIYGIRP